MSSRPENFAALIVLMAEETGATREQCLDALVGLCVTDGGKRPSPVHTPPANSSDRPFDAFKFRERVMRLPAGMPITTREILQQLHMQAEHGSKRPASVMRREGWRPTRNNRDGYTLWEKPLPAGAPSAPLLEH